MSTVQEAEAFINESRCALESLFQSLGRFHQARTRAALTVGALEAQKESLSARFVDQDQWSPNANHLYAQWRARVDALNAERQEILDRPDPKARYCEFLRRDGATHESMAILAGAILQIGKQTLSFRFGNGKPNIPRAKMIGSQSIVEVIWEGRNHALHWEDSKASKRNAPAREMLRKLQADASVRIDSRDNNSLSILEALGWSNADAVIDDLKQLVVATSNKAIQSGHKARRCNAQKPSER